MIRTRENTDIFITLDVNVYGSHNKRVNITVVYRTVASNGTCDSVRRVIAYLGFGFQADHLFILFYFFIVFDYSQPVWMLAETRLDNNCSLVIAKCWRNGLLVGRDFQTQWTITANTQILGVSRAVLQLVERMVQIEPLDFFLFIFFYLNFCILFYLNNT